MTNKTKEYNFMSDTTFKYFFKNKEYRNWFYEIIKEKTGVDLEDYELYNNESNTGNRIKDYRFDIVLVKDNETIIIEANNSDEDETSELKAHMYLFRKESEQFLEGENYTPKYTKLIMFNNYYNKENKNISMAHYKYEDRKNNLELNYIESYAIYLPNYHKVCYDEIENEIDKRLYILGCKNMEEIKKLKTRDENLKIIKEYERLVSEDPGFMWEYEREKDARKMHNTGAIYAKIEIAKKMLQENMDISLISKITDLSLEEIKKIKEEISI